LSIHSRYHALPIQFEASVDTSGCKEAAAVYWLEEFSREAQILQAHVKNATGTNTFALGCDIKK